MEEADDNADEESARPQASSVEKEIVWSVGDRCLAEWTGDDQLCGGVVKKLRHTDNGKVLALVKFADYDSEDCEEVDVLKLRRERNSGDDGDGDARRAIGRAGGIPECSTSSSGLFSPLTGSEDISRLEDKYGRDSDSEEDETSEPGQWISPIPYQTKGKMSSWKVSSPAKSAVSVTRRGNKGPVVQIQSPGKMTDPTRRRGRDLSAQRKNGRKVSSNDSALGMSGEVSPLKRSESRSARGGDSSRLDEADDSALGISSEDGHFEGFDEDDMEKPKFSFSAPSDKVPFCLDESQGVQIPAPLNQYLRDYQRAGVGFLWHHYSQGRGAVLGDDMGLGKTVQVIGFLSALMGKQGNRLDVMRQMPRFIRQMSDMPELPERASKGPVMIIGPGSVLYNWLEELDTWGHFTVRKYHGSDKAACLADVVKGKVEIVVTTFETCRDNVDALNTVNWDAVIVDEVHRIKGLKAQTTIALRSLKCVCRYGLTGTALQNSMSELWCILDWAQPNVLGSSEDFEEDFVRPIELGQKQNATKRELAVARKKKEEFATVRKQMMLRRTKKLIADQLPVKTDRVVFCRLVPLQLSVYRAVLEHPDLRQVLTKNKPCPCGSGATGARCCLKNLKKGGRSARSVMFTFMHMLLKTSNHVALLIPPAKMAAEQAAQAWKLCHTAFREHPEFLELARDAAFRTLSDPQYCGKMKVLHGMLSVFAKQHSKVLIFSYSTRLLDILEQHVMSQGMEYRRIDGAVSARRRQQIVREFNSTPDIFLCLVSTKAGGLGLNMTGANKVVIFDPNWNPSHDLQAQDRAYRIGQRRDVEVYRLISAGSIEENIYLRQVYKQQLDNVVVGTENARRYFQGIQGDADHQGELFGMHNMFQLRTGDSCLTMDILKRNANMEATIAGHAMADYVPSWTERRISEGGATSQEEEEEDRGGNCGDSNDESSMEALKDLFDPSSDDSEEEGQAKKTKLSDPKPSTSGLHISRKTSTTKTAQSTKMLHNTPGKTPTPKTAQSRDLFEDSSDAEPDRTCAVSRPTTRQCRQQTGTTVIRWFDDIDNETGATEALSFLREADDDDDDELRPSKGKAPQRSKGKAPLRKRQREATGGVPVVSVEDSLVTPTFSSVYSVFDQCGVVHVHDNVRVVGGSRVEDHMTRCAMHDVFNLQANTQDPAHLCEPLSQPSSDENLDSGKAPSSGRKKSSGARDKKDHNCARTVDCGPWHLLVGQTPSAIRKKHWTQLKQLKGVEDEVTLAQEVLVASPEHRLRLLKELYTAQHDNNLHPTLESILALPEEKPQNKEGPRAGNAHRVSSKATGRNVKKRSAGQSRGRASKAAAVSRGRRRRGRGRGLLYTDDLDSQLTQNNPPSPSTTTHDDELTFDPMPGVSPCAKVKAIQKKRCRGRGGRGSGGGPSQQTLTFDDPSLKHRGNYRGQRNRRAGRLAWSHDAESVTGSATDKLTDRLTDRGEDGCTDRLGDRLTNRDTERATDRRTDRGKVRFTDRGAERLTDKVTDRATDRRRDRHTDRGTDNHRDSQHQSSAWCVETQDVDGLLSELGKRQSPHPESFTAVTDASHRKTHIHTHTHSDVPAAAHRSRFSLLDDIFGNPEDCEVRTRKPAPGAGKKQVGGKRAMTTSTTTHALIQEERVKVARISRLCSVTKKHQEQNRNQSSTSTESHEHTRIIKKTCLPESHQKNSQSESRPCSEKARKRSSVSSDVFSELMNNSTLRDDDVDCFGEPSQWKKRHKTTPPPPPLSSACCVERLLQKSSRDYQQLFESGHLVKKQRKDRIAHSNGDRQRHVTKSSASDGEGEVSRTEAKSSSVVRVCEGGQRMGTGNSEGGAGNTRVKHTDMGACGEEQGSMGLSSDVDPSGSLFS